MRFSSPATTATSAPCSCRCCSSAGHEVVGLDSDLFEDCTFGSSAVAESRAIRQGHPRRRRPTTSRASTRSSTSPAISNDPLGDLTPRLHLRHQPPRRRRTSRERPRRPASSGFLFSSSCSLYGAAATTSSTRAPRSTRSRRTGESKVLAEQDICATGRRRRSARRSCATPPPTASRRAARRPRGQQPRRLRAHDGRGAHEERRHAVAAARPHRGHLPRLPRRCSRRRARWSTTRRSTSGATDENYRIRDVADDRRARSSPAAASRFADGAGPDLRCYRVDCDKLADDRCLAFAAALDGARAASRSCTQAYVATGLTLEDFEGSRFLRIEHVKELQERGQLDDDLRWREPIAGAGVSARPRPALGPVAVLAASRAAGRAAAGEPASRSSSSARCRCAGRAAPPGRARTARAALPARRRLLPGCSLVQILEDGRRRRSCSSTTTCTSRRSPTSSCALA